MQYMRVQFLSGYCAACTQTTAKLFKFTRGGCVHTGVYNLKKILYPGTRPVALISNSKSCPHSFDCQWSPTLYDPPLQ